MSYDTSRALFLPCLIIGIIIELVCYFIDSPILTVVGVLLILFAIIQELLFDKCPDCKFYLGKVRGKLPKHCPNCGKKLY